MKLRIPHAGRLGSLPLWALAMLGLIPLLGSTPRTSAAEPRRLADTTYVDSWQLPNGLRVVTRDIRRTPGIAVTLAFGFGAEQDPAGLEGRASLLAHVAFLSAAGEFPERTFEDLDKNRPLGWRVEVGRRYTRLTEVAKIDQFPGVIHELGLRLAGVKTDPKHFAATKKLVAAQLAETYRDRLSPALSYQVRDVATPAGQERALAYATAKGVQSATLEEVAAALRATYVPANAVLSLAGNLKGSNIDVRRVIENEFGGIPAGTRAEIPPAAPITPRFQLSERSGIEIPFGVIGVIAPALADTAHPSFYLHSLLLGGHLASIWGRSEQVPSPFQYSLLDEPELLRVFPPIQPSDLDAKRIREAYTEALLGLARTTITYEIYTNLHQSVLWMMGGPLSSELRRRSRSEPSVLAALSTTAAMRELWGGEEFWSAYLDRFNTVLRPEFSRWADYFKSPEHQVQLMFVPADLMPK